MKCYAKLIIFSLVILTNLTSANTVENAFYYYQKGNFEEAYNAFTELAKLGNTEAQMNVGVMYVRGEYVDKDLIEGYGWVALSRENGETGNTEKIIGILEKRLGAEKLLLAKKRYAELLASYSNEAIEKSYLPSASTESDEGFTAAKILSKNAALYPEEMQRANVSGVVDVQYMVARDGTTRLHNILFTTHKYFSREAIRALKGFQYEPAKSNGEAVEEYGRKIRFSFVMSNLEIKDDAVEEVLKPLRETARTGGGKEKFNYAYAIDMLQTLGDNAKGGDELEFDSANHWFIKAAQDGYSPAKFELGRRITYGNRCAVDTQKGLFWLENAANQNLADAQFMLGLEYISGARIEKDIEKGLKLVEQAANTGMEAAKLKYAWILATLPDQPESSVKTALSYLEKVDVKKFHDKLSYYETATVIYASTGKTSKYYKKAVKEIDKYEIPSSKIYRIKAAIDEGRPYLDTL